MDNVKYVAVIEQSSGKVRKVVKLNVRDAMIMIASNDRKYREASKDEIKSHYKVTGKQKSKNSNNNNSNSNGRNNRNAGTESDNKQGNTDSDIGRTGNIAGNGGGTVSGESKS